MLSIATTVAAILTFSVDIDPVTLLLDSAGELFKCVYLIPVFVNFDSLPLVGVYLVIATRLAVVGQGIL